MAAYASWAKTADPTARTSAARQASFDRFERQVDPDGVLEPAERRRRAEAAQRAYMTNLAYRSSRARQRRRTTTTTPEETTMVPSPEGVWCRIVDHAGETFTQIRGGEFTYAVEGDYLDLDRTNQKVPRQHVEEALDLVPLANTMPLQHLRAPSYIFAILMDERIRAGEW